MPKKMYKKREDAEEYTIEANKSFAEITSDIQGSDNYQHIVDWKELALYNWGTDKKNELNRMFFEQFGADKDRINADDPENTVLNPDVEKKILIPMPYTEPVEITNATIFTVRSPFPPVTPAVSIKELTPWFIPKEENCESKYCLEGSKDRANKVDFEIHTKNYYKLQQKEDGTEIWNTQVLCDTQDEESTTHIHQEPTTFELTDNVATEAENSVSPWDGTCTVTKGILAPDKTINCGCAPYTGLIRFYKNDDDNKAKIVLENFHPHWKQPPAPATDTDVPEREIEVKSLIVKWDVKGDNGKLKIGQLQVWDKDDTIVYCKALNEDVLQTKKKLDLAACWGAANFERDKMPYRVQIQAHSDEQEEDGLALAVMHTCVKSRVYSKAKMIGYDISPPAPYNGDPDDEADIKTRCKIMKEAITEAYDNITDAGDKKDSVLKVFMAPEFFFRGTKGGYKMTKDDTNQSDWSLTSTIMESLREETDQFKYADWLFIFGTVIGYEPYSIGDTEKVFEWYEETVRIMEIGGGDQHRLVRITTPKAKIFHDSIKSGKEWHIKQDVLEDKIIDSTLEDKDKCWLKLEGKDTAFAENKECFLLEPITILEINSPEIKVKSNICKKIPFTVGEVYWSIDQNPNKTTIKKCDKESDGIYILTLDDCTGLATGKAKLIEPPGATEIFNIALVKKGWPAYLCELKGTEEKFTVGGGKTTIKQRIIDKNDKADYLDEALIYKEYVSSIDYTKVTDFSDRKIIIDGSPTIALPTYGSKDELGANPNLTGSEINESGIGGGTVFTIDGVTFGLEVCLDHMYNRLNEFYNGSNVNNGDPKVQIQLIPSWGMRIESGDIACLADGLLFNVDGRPLSWPATHCGGSVLYENKPDYTCSEHTDVVLATFRDGKCGLKHHYCPDCDITKPSDNFTCGHDIFDMGFCENCGVLDYEDPDNLGYCYSCGNELTFCQKVLKLENPTNIHSTQHDVTSDPTNCFHDIDNNNRINIFDSKGIPPAKSVKK